MGRIQRARGDFTHLNTYSLSAIVVGAHKKGKRSRSNHSRPCCHRYRL